MTNTPCKWNATAFALFCDDHGILPEWEPELPGPDQTVLTLPEGKISFYEAHFSKCGFRLPCTRFQLDTLIEYGVAVSQVSGFGMLRLGHFENQCRALD